MCVRARSSSCSRFLDADANTPKVQESCQVRTLATDVELALVRIFFRHRGLAESSRKWWKAAQRNLLFYWSLSSCTAALEQARSSCKTTSSDGLSRKFSVVWSELQSAEDLATAARHDLHKARRAVLLRWMSRAVEASLDLLEESAPVSDLFRC